MKKYLLITAGSITLALGVAGIFLPVLPTTPFLLLSAWCYLRSSIRLYNWLINHRVLGLYIYSYLTYRAITLKAKVTMILTLWLVMVSTIIFFIDPLWLRILLAVIGCGVTVHLVTIKTLTAEMKEEIRQEPDREAL
ncbi:MAG: YbaN family protein [Spirochaetales bacterium]|nr:YbaN family protein [Spirochaetales bacterium]